MLHRRKRDRVGVSGEMGQSGQRDNDLIGLPMSASAPSNPSQLSQSSYSAVSLIALLSLSESCANAQLPLKPN